MKTNRIRHALRAALLCLAIFGLAAPAQADSFLTSVGTKSKTAARVAPKPYRGNTYTPHQVKYTASKALSTIKHTRNVAIGLDVIRRVDGVAMYHPQVGEKFRRGLVKLSKSGDPKMSLLRGVNLVMRNASSRRGIARVRKAARALPNNSAAQLAAGLSVAQRDAFHLRSADWEKKTPLKREAARLMNNAKQLENKTRHPRPLVREGLKQAKEYAGYYGGYKGLVK